MAAFDDAEENVPETYRQAFQDGCCSRPWDRYISAMPTVQYLRSFWSEANKPIKWKAYGSTVVTFKGAAKAIIKAAQTILGTENFTAADCHMLYSQGNLPTKLMRARNALVAKREQLIDFPLTYPRELDLTDKWIHLFDMVDSIMYKIENVLLLGASKLYSECEKRDHIRNLVRALMNLADTFARAHQTLGGGSSTTTTNSFRIRYY